MVKSWGLRKRLPGEYNDVAFPATGWNETYWTVGENTVTWNTKT